MEGLGIEEEAGLPSSETQEKRMRKGSQVSISWERGGVGEAGIRNPGEDWSCPAGHLGWTSCLVGEDSSSSAPLQDPYLHPSSDPILLVSSQAQSGKRPRRPEN